MRLSFRINRLEHPHQGFAQGIHLAGLEDHLGDTSQRGLPRQVFLDKAGRNDHWKSGLQCPHLVGHIEARHTWHVVIGDHHIETVRCGTQSSQRLVLVRISADSITTSFQQAFDQKDQRLFIIEIENMAAGALVPQRRCLDGRR